METNIKYIIRVVKRCLYCNAKLHNNITAKYCKPSCRTQAYKHRKILKDLKQKEKQNKDTEEYDRLPEDIKENNRHFDNYIKNLEKL